MSAAVAEIQQEHERPHLYEVTTPVILRADLLEQDQGIKLECERFIGQVSLGASVEKKRIVEPGMHDSLLDSLEKTKEGIETARASARKNVKFAAIETLYKVEHITSTQSEIDEYGKPIQHGQSHRTVQENALMFASATREVLERTEAETLNAFRIEDYIQSGILETHWLMVPSLFADNMTTSQARKAGLFTQTMTGIFQGTTVEKGTLLTESAFVAGTPNELDEDDEILGKPRPDKQAMADIYEELELDLPEGFTTTDLLYKPLLIPKEFMPSGVIDFVKVYDQKMGGTFFGQSKDEQDYDGNLAVCKEREKNLETTIDTILSELLSEVGNMSTPIDAINKLYDLTKKHILKHAFENEDVNLAIFGREAAANILYAREMYAVGDIVAMDKALERAEESAIVSMCGGGNDKKNKEKKSDNDNPIEDIDPFDDEKESKTGKIRCFRCKQVVDKKDVVKETTWCCPKCHYEIDICDGRVVNEGDEIVKDNDEEATVYHFEDMFRQKQEDNKQSDE